MYRLRCTSASAAEAKADVLKRSFVFWIGQVVTISAILSAMLP